MSGRSWERWSSQSPYRLESSDVEDRERELRRRMGSGEFSRPGALRQGAALEQYPSLKTFEFVEADQRIEDIDTATRNLLTNGCTINDLNMYDVLPVMKESAVVKLGTFFATAENVIKAFKEKGMLTRGSHTLYDPDLEVNWKTELRESTTRTRSVLSRRWKDTIKLGAYAVRIRNIADCDHGSVLERIIAKRSSGLASKKIWEFPSVKAVVSYHWDHWARLLVYTYFVLFLLWVCSYVFFMILYIGLDDSKSLFTHGKNGQQLASHLFNALSLIFMLPSLFEIILSLRSQGRSYFEFKNTLDIAPVVFQVLISVLHAPNLTHNNLLFELLLVCQCVLLFTKVQQFGSAIGRSSHISLVFVQVMYDVRYMLFYIIYSTFSAALCLGILYKRDKRFQEDDDVGRHFDSFGNALVTTFGVTFGNFDVKYVLQAGDFWIKAMFFLVFQTYMTITVLNLLIAVMSNSYSKVEKNIGNNHERNRAEVIHSLEVIGVTKLFRIDLPQYVHFLVVEFSQTHEICHAETDTPLDQQDLKAQVHNLTNVVQQLAADIKSLKEANERNMQTVLSAIEEMMAKKGRNDAPIEPGWKQ